MWDARVFLTSRAYSGECGAIALVRESRKCGHGVLGHGNAEVDIEGYGASGLASVIYDWSLKGDLRPGAG